MGEGPTPAAAGRLLALLAAALPATTGWVNVPTVEQGETQRYKLLWTKPAERLDQSGLGGGLAFAIDPSFCETMEPYFREDAPDDIAFKPFNWVDCSEINDVLARAMSTWSINHPYIQFYNVTDECIAEGKAEDCSLVEIWITARSAPGGVEDVAAFVEYLEPDGGWRNGPRTPAGRISYSDWVIEKVRLTFHVGGAEDVCWFIDNSFCFGLRALHANADALTILKWLIFGLWAFGYAGSALGMLFVLRKVFVRDGRCCVCQRSALLAGLADALRVLSRWQLSLWLVMILVFSPPVVWNKVVLPCLECFDFGSAAAHEIGHVLGFSHPDIYADLYRVADEQMGDDDVCTRAHRLPGTRGAPTSIDPDDPTRAQSIMTSMTTTRATACLSENDLDGLNFLYPVCEQEAVKPAPALCVVSKRNIGWARIAVNILPPAAFAALALQLLVQVSMALQARRQARNRWQLATRLVHADIERERARERRLGLRSRMRVRLRRRSGQYGSAADDVPLSGAGADGGRADGAAPTAAAGTRGAAAAAASSDEEEDERPPQPRRLAFWQRPRRAAAPPRPSIQRSRAAASGGGGGGGSRSASNSASPRTSRSPDTSRSPGGGPRRNMIQYDKRSGRYIVTSV